MQEVRPRTSAPVVAGSSSLQRGCLEAVPTPREIPWLCVPPSPAVCPLERSYLGGRQKTRLTYGVRKRGVSGHKNTPHYAQFTTYDDIEWGRSRKTLSRPDTLLTVTAP